jgi:hypothetical protein
MILAEVLKTQNPKTRLFWIGNGKFDGLIHLNGLCENSNINIKVILDKYPVPIFLDKYNNVYFNLLNNYIIRKSYWGMYEEVTKKPILKQLMDNFTIPWDGQLPIMRKLTTDKFRSWCNINHIRDNSKIILIIINNDTIHDIDCLKWNIHNIKELSAFVSNIGFKVVIASKEHGLYYGSKLITIDYDYSMIFQLIKKSLMVLSTSIDWLLISMLISKCYIGSIMMNDQLSLFNNADVINAKNVIFTDKEWLSPMDVYAICGGI